MVHHEALAAGGRALDSLTGVTLKEAYHLVASVRQTAAAVGYWERVVPLLLREHFDGRGT